MDSSRLRGEADKAVKSTIHKEYGNKARYYGEQWLIPLPELHLNISPVPQLIITVGAYLVFPVKVETDYSSYSATVVGNIEKSEVLVMPMTFLQALLDNDLGRFRLVAKDSSHTTWKVPEAKPVELPNDFVSKLPQIFERKSVAMWLEDFGSQGRTVAPQVVGALLGLQSIGVAQPIPTGQQAWSEETIINALVEGMAYTTTEAKEMFKRAAPNLRADHTLEEAIRLILQQMGKGGQS
jgi:hypothetical protein